MVHVVPASFSENGFIFSFSHANDLNKMDVEVYAEVHESIIMAVESCYVSGCGFDSVA